MAAAAASPTLRRPAARTPEVWTPSWRRPTKSSSKLDFADTRRLHDLFGSHDLNVKAIESALGVSVSLTESGISITGDEPSRDLAGRVLTELYGIVGPDTSLGPHDVTRAIDILSRNSKASLKEVLQAPVFVADDRTGIAPKTVNQRTYVDAINCHDVVFAIGPAGTGKTYLAMAMACAALVKGQYERIILTRPAVEAGEKLGFLPGDLAEKVNPYLRPLYDALYALVGTEKAAQMVERGTVEVAPLAFMRGRTLNKAVVILDEAQNTSREQMKMFLTRLGFDSKAIITGDVTQIDLPDGRISGLNDARKVLSEIVDIKFVYFDERDVVRHPLVKRIIGAYEQANGVNQGHDGFDAG